LRGPIGNCTANAIGRDRYDFRLLAGKPRRIGDIDLAAIGKQGGHENAMLIP
jgi:hypothetical protein